MAAPDALFPEPAAATPAPGGRSPKGQRAAAPTAVASVRIDSPVPHLDRPFDYAIPVALADRVQVGSRVRVRIAGRLTSAVVTRIAPSSSFEGTLLDIRSSSLVPSYTREALDLAERVAERYCGSTWDVLRLMAPPRVASVEKRDWSAPEADQARLDAARGALDAAPVAQRGERVVWEALPEGSRRASVPAEALAATALAQACADRSAIIVVPDARALRAVLARLEDAGLRRWTSRSGGEVAVLDHDDGPTARFGSYLAAMHGHARIVLGTRPTALQPVPRLGVIAVWDEANGGLEDQHAPYPHARTVAAMRVESGHEQDAALVLGGYALSAEAAALVEHGWARFERPARDTVRAAAPAIDVLTAERRDAEGAAGWHWMPGSAWRSLMRAVEDGPVGVIVPRAGYVHAVACATCEAWAVCRDCKSPLALPAAGADPVCLDAGHAQADWHCPECQGSALKQLRQGAVRIGEQLARMLRGVPLTVSTAQAGVVADGAVTAGMVLATPAALPAVEGGYAHLAILDAGVPAGLGLGGELLALRWWLSAAALVRGRRDGGAVTVVGDMPDRVRRALASWNPGDAALDEVRERAALGLPPHRRYVTVRGDRVDVDGAVRAAGLDDDGVTVVPVEGGTGLLIPRGTARRAMPALRRTQQAASRAGRELRIRVDGPLEPAR